MDHLGRRFWKIRKKSHASLRASPEIRPCPIAPSKNRIIQGLREIQHFSYFVTNDFTRCPWNDRRKTLQMSAGRRIELADSGFRFLKRSDDRWSTHLAAAYRNICSVVISATGNAGLARVCGLTFQLSD
jgi:hypothetical protein